MFRIRETVEFFDDCMTVNRRISGMDVKCDFKSTCESRLEQFDEVAEHLLTKIKNQIDEKRKQISKDNFEASRHDT